MANQWLIVITGDEDAVEFTPFVPDTMPGDPLLADAGDTVVWSNHTDVDLDLESDDPSASDLDQTLPAGESSAALFVVPAGGVKYHCTQPFKEHQIKA